MESIGIQILIFSSYMLVKATSSVFSSMDTSMDSLLWTSKDLQIKHFILNLLLTRTKILTFLGDIQSSQNNPTMAVLKITSHIFPSYQT